MPESTKHSPPLNLCVLGSLNMDLVIRTERFPRPGETVLGRSFSTYPGGKGANQAVAAARLGARVHLVGARGDDEHGRRLHAALEAEGVDTRCTHVRPDVPTGVASILVDGEGQNCIVVAPNANATLSPADVEAVAEDLLAGCDGLLIQLEVPMETVLRGVTVARAAGVPVLLNAAPARSLPEELLAGVDALILNHTEALTLCGRADGQDVDLGELAEVLLELGPGMVVLTLGSEGAVLYPKGEEPLLQPAYVVEVVDTTAAGDAFAAAFAVEWCRSRDPARALRLAAAAGALTCTRAGAQPSLPRAQEVARLVSRGGGPRRLSEVRG